MLSGGVVSIVISIYNALSFFMLCYLQYIFQLQEFNLSCDIEFRQPYFVTKQFFFIFFGGGI
jgi:hypothetical protein